MPDEQSNLKSSAPAARSGGNRRRGRRGGRGRGPRPVGDKPGAEENSPAPSTAEISAETAAPIEATEAAPQTEHEAEATGGFREPHSDVPEGFSSHEEVPPVEIHEPESVAEAAPVPPVREPRREQRRDDRRDLRPSPPPPRIPVSQRQWVKPADFRPAETSAISEAVAHATFIANALKELHDQLDEVLELIEVAERQKIADERELDELRRALRRIQPQRQQPPPERFQPPQRSQPRRDEPRRPQSPRERPENRPEPPPSPEAELPHTD